MADTETTYRHTYHPAFFRCSDAASRQSAAAVTRRLAPELRPRTLLDMGCGRGAWLAAWSRQGVETTVGVDGAYVLAAGLVCPESRFVPHDLCLPLDLGRTFDLVQSLEVGEHLPDVCAEVFVDSLCRHGGRILFSSAPPGQGGENHVNERPHEYWRAKFARRGYRLFDYPRIALARLEGVAWWYARNMFLYVAPSHIDGLPAAVRDTALPEGTPIVERTPPALRLRFAVVSALPGPLVSFLAHWRYRLSSALSDGAGRPPEGGPPSA